jgi:UDP-N-acetylmuramate--L-alanine ligase/UDP-N-acetylenolpyruvoylglucosamine reductase
LVVHSSAIQADNSAVAAAMAAGIPLWRRAECLAAILNARRGIVIAGTHGKTTTSSMAAHVLREAGLDPSHYVGAEIPVLGANAHWSTTGGWMVAEGDESDGTLALYRPEHAVILNIEAEHLDYYRDLDQIRQVFAQLAAQTSGNVIYCADDPVAREVCGSLGNSVSYGWQDADYTATAVRDLRGSSSFTVMRRGTTLGDIELGVPGRHNVLNALAAIALADLCGADFRPVARALAGFAGAKRRFETKYLGARQRVVDDYGHHPTELAATLQTARSLAPKRVVVLFQPHRYTRTQALADDFGKALQAADRVFVTDVYPASEPPIEGVSGMTIVDAMRHHGAVPATHLPDLSTAHHAVGNALQPGDLLLTLGAGNVHEAGARLVRDLQRLDAMLALAPAGAIDGRLYEPMSRHTTLLVGGPAQFWLEPHTFEAFAALVNHCRALGIPLRVVGRGSNLLVRDGGIRGAVIRPSGGAFAEVCARPDGTIVAGVGVRLKKLASVAAAAGIGGFEWMEGIPGNVGGALRMNAGAMGIETFDQIVSVTVLDEDGNIRTRTREEMHADYRDVPELRRQFALQAVFHGQADEPEAIQSRWDASRVKRKTTQPVNASAGCTFRNPQTIPAGQLIETLGLKGHGIGGAEVSPMHANFIVNRGGARAADLLALIDAIRNQAREQRGIELETEVKILGEDQPCF